MKPASAHSALLLLSSVVVLAFSINPACSDATKPGPIPIPEKIYVDYLAVWSGTHDLIAYIHYQKPESDDLDSSGIYIIKPDGTEKRLLYRSDFVMGLDWAQDGQWLVTNDNDMLVIISFPEGEGDTLTESGQYFNPVWSVNGTCIAFAKHWGENRGIYIMNTEATESRKIIRNGMFVDWPYSDSIIYLNFETGYPIGAICLADTGGLFRRVVFQPEENIISSTPRPKMHGASGRIVLDAQEIGQLESIWTLEPGATEATRLRSNAMRPNFSPDGDRIVFTHLEGDIGRLWIMNWDGSGLSSLLISEKKEGSLKRCIIFAYAFVSFLIS